MDNDSLSVISDYDCEDGATAIQKHWRRQAAKVFFSRWKPMLIFRTSRRKAAVVVQRRWIRNRRKRNAVVALQAHARRKYLWGVNGECSDTVLKVFELRNVIGSMRHALSIVRYVQFLVDHSELLEIVSKCTLALTSSDGSGQMSIQYCRGTNLRHFFQSSTCLMGLIPGGISCFN